MSSTRPHSAHTTQRPKPDRRIPQAAVFSDPVSDIAPDRDGLGFGRGGSRKGVRLSLIVLSAGALCAFGFGLLAELLG